MTTHAWWRPTSWSRTRSGHALYLIAHDSYSGAVRTFKVERIKAAELTDERFEGPADFDASRRFRHAWGVVGEEPVEVRILFHDSAAAARARETRWHPSQQEIERPDGTLEVAFMVGGTLESTRYCRSRKTVLQPPRRATRHATASGRPAAAA